jgi:hypothetical protein
MAQIQPGRLAEKTGWEKVGGEKKFSGHGVIVSLAAGVQSIQSKPKIGDCKVLK